MSPVNFVSLVGVCIPLVIGFIVNPAALLTIPLVLTILLLLLGLNGTAFFDGGR